MEYTEITQTELHNDLKNINNVTAHPFGDFPRCHIDNVMYTHIINFNQSIKSIDEKTGLIVIIIHAFLYEINEGSRLIQYSAHWEYKIYIYIET